MYNSAKLLNELHAAIPAIISAASDGTYTATRTLTAAEAQQASAIIAAHDPTPEPDEATVLNARIAALEAALKRAGAIEKILVNNDIIKTVDIETAIADRA